MNDKIKDIIKEALKGYHIDKIILFGSRARRDNNELSDYDVYIIIKENIERVKRIEITDAILERLAVKHICADIIIRSVGDVEKFKNQIGTITYDVLKEGIVI